MNTLSKSLILAGILIIFLSTDDTRDYHLEKLCNAINTPAYDEISPVVSTDGQTLYFTRVAYPEFEKSLIIEGEDIAEHESEGYYHMQLQWVYKQLSGREMEDPSSSELNQDVWISHAAGNESFDQVIHPGAPLNNALPNSICAITKQGKEMIVINQFDPNGGMQPGFSKITTRQDGSWSFPKPIEIQDFENNQEEVSISLNHEGTLMLISMSDERSLGDHDIYISKKIGADRWSKPIHLGPIINTKYREVAPYLSEDSRTLYFASNRPGGLGGMDIYYTVRQGQGWKEWSEPRKFYFPINSKYDDSQPRFNKATGYLYFSSKRDGSSDIYRSKIDEPSVLNYAFETNQIRGKIVNKGNSMPIPATVDVILMEENKVFSTYQSKDGSYLLDIPIGEKIEVKANLDGFISHSKYFSFQKGRDYEISQNIDLFLEPIRKGSKIEHAPIYFDRSTSKFIPSAMPELRRLAQTLIRNPKLQVEIQGHTDNIGKKEELVMLSLERANAVREFLISQGVSIERLSIKGLGAKYPIVSNMDEQSRRKNRRVEFKIAQIEESRN